MPLDKQRPSVFARGCVDKDGRTSTKRKRVSRSSRTNRLAMLRTREKRAREEERGAASRENGMERENAGSSPRSSAVLCRRNKLLGLVAQNERRFRSLVFAIIAVTAVDLHRGATDRSNYSFSPLSQSVVITAGKYGLDSPVTGRSPRCKPRIRDERVPHVARALRL